MPEYTAMMNLASYVEAIHSELMLDNLPDSIKDTLQQSIDIILNIVKGEIKDVENMSLPDLYYCADMILENELKKN